jgi:hypothetical protein
MKERRRVKREALAGRVEVGPDGGFSLTHDISLGGVRILTDRYVPQNADLRLRISLPGTGRSITGTGNVRWFKRYEKDVMYETGLEFVNIPAASRKALESYLG